MHFFLTGHTGFKGAWLTLLLKQLGHEVSGFSLPALNGSLFERANLANQMRGNFVGDVRDKDALEGALSFSKPDVAIHLAAQPLVLRSYDDPFETFTTNVDGTLNFLEAVRKLKHPPICLVVTTDKVYKDTGSGAYSEDAPLGGHDPYSASKAMADLLTQSWAATYPDQRVRIARAGNVIGAFDVSENRLIPDIVRSGLSKVPLEVRNPGSVRPWQHVLDCLWGYYLLVESLNTESASIPVALNFGPDSTSFRSVESLVAESIKLMPELAVSIKPQNSGLKETSFLTLDARKAKSILDWKPMISFEKALEWSLVELTQDNALDAALNQIKEFLTASGWHSKS